MDQILRTKVDPVQGTGEHRVLGTGGATGMIVAATVGSGIFALTGQFGASVGSTGGVLFPWVIGAVLALCGGLSLAELASMMPCSGGSIEGARRAFGATVGYLVAMVTILAGYLMSNAVIALFLAEYLDRLIPGDAPDTLLAVGAILVALVSQLPGLRMGFAANSALAVVKVGVIAAFVIAGLSVEVTDRLVAEPAASTPSVFSPQVATAVLLVSFAYLGWSTGADIAGDLRDPGRTLPRAMIASIVLVAALYLGINAAYLRVIDPGAMVEADGSDMRAIGSVAAGLLFGPQIGTAMTVAIALLLLSTIVSCVITSARILESMARAGEAPAWLGVRREDGVPQRALVVVAALSAASLAIGSLGELLDLLTVLVNVFSALTVAALFVLRRTMPNAPRPFKVPLYPWVPALYLALAGWTVVSSIMTGGARTAWASCASVIILLLLRPLVRGRPASGA
ncbi:MAG: amino acid permease [Phycisphaerae bacterium]|nr:amino acid permease [Phycisphaerae bacterium]